MRSSRDAIPSPFDPGPFFEASPEPSVVLGCEGRLLAANGAFEDRFGWAPADIVGRPVRDLVAARDRPEFEEALARPGGCDELRGDIRAPDGGPARAAVWTVGPGASRWRGAVVRRAEGESRRGRRDEALETNTRAGSWERDIRSGATHWSPGLHALFRTDPATFDPRNVDRVGTLVGDSVERYLEANSALEREGTPYDLELNLRPFEGPDIWVRATGTSHEDGRWLHGTMRDVTEERERRLRLERLSAVAQMTTTGVMIQKGDGIIEWVNDALVAQLGYSFDELVGKRPSMLYSPNTDPEVQETILAAKANRQPMRIELVNRHRDGHDVHFSIDARPILDEDGTCRGWISVRTDVTEFLRTQRSLARAEREAETRRRELASAVEVLEDAFALHDPDDRLVVCNGRYRELYERSAPAIEVGARYEDVLRYGLKHGQYPEARGREGAWLAARMADHRQAERTVEQRLPGGRWSRLVERATPDGGRVSLSVDITEMKRQQHVLENALRRAEEAGEAKSTFLATMSHEIRTPMNGILGLADLLATSRLAPEDARIVSDIRHSGEALLRILNDILDFSKIEAGRIDLESIAFDPAELASRIEALYGAGARAKGLALRLDVEPGPVRLGDPTRLQQVLGNLVSNAIKFTPSGGIRLAVRNASGSELRFEVEDSGMGMAEEVARTVFERFAQADSSVTRNFGGTGLGLSIVQGLVEAMEGRLDVRSAPGEGTCIGVSLPSAESSAPAVRAPATPEADLRGVRVLAADDNQMNRRVLAGLLDRLGAGHEIVESGAAVVEAARRADHDVLLLDISMPGMDGVEALALIRSEAQKAGRAPAPAVAVTANVLADQVDGYLAAGFAGHLPKPVRMAALCAAVREVASVTARRHSAAIDPCDDPAPVMCVAPPPAAGPRDGPPAPPR